MLRNTCKTECSFRTGQEFHRHQNHPACRSRNSWTALIYQSSSPDEVAILNFARKYKYIFLGRNDDKKIKIKKPEKNELNELIYKIPIQFEYTSERKSMSIIIQNQINPNDIYLFMKGADSIILDKLDKNNNINKLVIQNLKESLDKYSKEGLRILAVAYKRITLEELNEYQKEFIKASKNIYKKKEKLEELSKIIEKDLIFLGVTGIEDELQDEVNETLKDFSDAGIKLWVLTGDKKNTAKSIAFSCGLFDEKNFNIFEIKEGLNKAELESNLNELEQRVMKEISIDPLTLDSIALRLNIDVSDLMLTLTTMELNGQIKQIEGAKYIICN